MTILPIGALSQVFSRFFWNGLTAAWQIKRRCNGRYWRVRWKRPIGKIVIFEIAPFIIQISITFLKQRLSSPLRYQNTQNKFTRFMNYLLFVFKDYFMEKCQPILVFRYFLCVVYVSTSPVGKKGPFLLVFLFTHHIHLCIQVAPPGLRGRFNDNRYV